MFFSVHWRGRWVNQKRTGPGAQNYQYLTRSRDAIDSSRVPRQAPVARFLRRAELTRHRANARGRARCSTPIPVQWGERCCRFFPAPLLRNPAVAPIDWTGYYAHDGCASFFTETFSYCTRLSFLFFFFRRIRRTLPSISIFVRALALAEAPLVISLSCFLVFMGVRSEGGFR